MVRGPRATIRNNLEGNEARMFESAELGHKVDKATYRAAEPVLRELLLDAQNELKERRDFPVVMLFGGVKAAGKGETVRQLLAWLDPRQISTYALSQPTDEEAARPPLWRFWRVLPPKGRMAMLFEGWYRRPLDARIAGEIDGDELDASIHEINRFEQLLVAEGALILKFWLHLTKDAQKKRLKRLSKDPLTAWRVTDRDREALKKYDRIRNAGEEVMRLTSTAHAPWTVLDGSDERYRHLTVGRMVEQALVSRLASPPQPPEMSMTPIPRREQRTVLTELDMDQKLAGKEYRRRLAEAQGRLSQLFRHKKFGQKAVIAVFEGSDAAGKGGTIRRITGALDPRQYQVVPVAAPTEEERAQPYLWRFWRHVPELGRLTIFDRSWYGRVLVERVEELCPASDWQRAYEEINDFERELDRYGVLVVKFWLAITKEEQLARFKDREKTGFKRFKITPEDWRNREKWDSYADAVCDMVDRTSTSLSPWTLVAANDKRHARVTVLETLCERIEDAL